MTCDHDELERIYNPVRDRRHGHLYECKECEVLFVMKKLVEAKQ